MKIRNFNELAVTKLRESALLIAEAGLQAIDTGRVIKEKIKISGEFLLIESQKIDLGGIKRILLAGVGKCALDGAAALEEVLGERLFHGLVIDIKNQRLNKVQVFEGDHPLPSERNAAATAKLINFLSGLDAHDLLIFIVSGGGSTLLSQPVGITSVEEAVITRTLIEGGADIKKMNTLRKHISLARGGFLAKYAYPARIVSLVFSDVLSDELEFIASGPLVKDTTSVVDAEGILKEYAIQSKLNKTVTLIETPKEDRYFENVRHILLVSNKMALEAMTKEAKGLGFNPGVGQDFLRGEARAKGEEIISKLHDTPHKSALIYGGETTVTVKAGGKGGRNQELALSALGKIEKGEIVVPLASDGSDNGDAAGGICDIITREKAQKKGLDIGQFLLNNDSASFFEKTGDNILTGPTGSNVADFLVALKE